MTLTDKLSELITKYM